MSTQGQRTRFSGNDQSIPEYSSNQQQSQPIYPVQPQTAYTSASQPQPQPYSRTGSTGEYDDYMKDQYNYPSKEYNPDRFSGSKRYTGMSQAPTVFDLNTPVSLIEFRILLGMSPEPGSQFNPAPPNINAPHIMPKWIRKLWIKTDPESTTSIYYSVLYEEVVNRFQSKIYQTAIVSALVVQLVISAALIILGAACRQQTISIAILGAVNGIITGLLSLIRGQGLPTRLIKYSELLRNVREDIEWSERQLRAGINVITYQTVFDLRQQYEKVREMQVNNHPDIWNVNTSTPLPYNLGLSSKSAQAKN